MDWQYWVCRPISSMQVWVQEVGLLLLLLLLILWQISDRPYLAWCTVLIMVAIIIRAVAKDISQANISIPGHTPRSPRCTSDRREVSMESIPTMETSAAHFHIHDMSTRKQYRSDGSTSVPFDTEVASGRAFFIHRRLEEDDAAISDKHALYFMDKRRNWELRFQCTPKKAIRACELRIGCAPFERQPISWVQAAVQRSVLGFAGTTLGNGVYNSPGDDPETAEVDEIEIPVSSIPVCESDQYIAPGGLIPSLTEHQAFSQRGILKTSSPSAYRKELTTLILEAGETYTFSFWGPARFFHLIKWEISGIPIASGRSLDDLNGPPPLMLMLFVLRRDEQRPDDLRHLPSRMDELLKTAGYSSNNPPTDAVLRLLEASPKGSAITTGASGNMRQTSVSSDRGSARFVANCGCWGGLMALTGPRRRLRTISH